jgi:hypothetical protein
VVLAGTVATLAWAPILVAEPTALRSMRPTVALADDSVLALLGLTDATVPSWLRFAQLVGCVLLAAVAVARGRPDAVLAIAVAGRIASDPGTWSYYTPGLVLGALLIDVGSPRHRLPWLCLGTSVLVGPAWMIASADARAVGRLGALVVVLAVILVGSGRPLTTPSTSAALRGEPPRLALGKG